MHVSCKRLALSGVSLTVISIELMTNPKNVNTLFGRNTDLSGWIMNPKSCKSKAVFLKCT